MPYNRELVVLDEGLPSRSTHAVRYPLITLLSFENVLFQNAIKNDESGGCGCFDTSEYFAGKPLGWNCLKERVST